MTQSTNKFEQLLELLINEENDKATEELEKLATDEPKKYPH